jgi:hypothetical protein
VQFKTDTTIKLLLGFLKKKKSPPSLKTCVEENISKINRKK